MSYYFSKKLHLSFEASVLKVSDKLKEYEFGILNRIDIHKILNEKLNVDFYSYTILGACNPSLAYQALQVEDKVGLMLPCNVIVQQKDKDAFVEVSAVDPIQSMSAIKSDELEFVASKVAILLKKVISEL